MFKIIVSTGHICVRNTLEEINNWLEKRQSLGTLGRNERWKTEEEFDSDETVNNCIASRINEINGGYVTEYRFPADYTYTITDISAEVLAEEVINNRRREYGSITDQLDEIFHDVDAWRARIQGIKDKYPK